MTENLDIERALRAVLANAAMYGLGENFSRYNELADAITSGILAGRTNLQFGYDPKRLIKFSPDGEMLPEYFTPEEIEWAAGQRKLILIEVKAHRVWGEIVDFEG